MGGITTAYTEKGTFEWKEKVTPERFATTTDLAKKYYSLWNNVIKMYLSDVSYSIPIGYNCSTKFLITSCFERKWQES